MAVGMGYAYDFKALGSNLNEEDLNEEKEQHNFEPAFAFFEAIVTCSMKICSHAYLAKVYSMTLGIINT